MNNQYLFIILFPFVPLTAMEQGASFVQRSTLKAAPSLEVLAGRAYAKFLHNNVPQKTLSDSEMIEWAKQCGLNIFFDLEMGNLLSHVLSEPIIDPDQNILKKILGHCPIFSPDGSFCLELDFKNKKQYLVYYHDESIRKEIPECLYFDSDHSWCNPLFSSEGKWLLGSSEKTGDLLVMRCALSDDKKKLDVTLHNPSVTLNNSMDYTLLDEETILIRNAKEIFKAPIADFALQGKSVLQKIYSRNDGTEFLSTPFFKTMYPIDTSLIACVGNNLETIELLKSDTNGLSLIKTVSFQTMGLGKVVVYKGRGIALIERRSFLKGFFVYDLSIRQEEVSRVPVPMTQGGRSFYVFSPDGLFVAYDTWRGNNDGIEICDLRNPAAPVSIAFIETTAFKMIKTVCVAWLKQGLLVSNWHFSDHVLLNFTNSAEPLVARYAAYREKQKEEKATGKNAS